MTEQYRSAELAIDSTETREFVPMFRSIDVERADALIGEISLATGVDFSSIPVEVVGPGDILFDLQEAQTKLYHKARSWQAYIDLLERYGVDHDKLGRMGKDGVEILRDVARKEGINLDDSFEGFVYNIGGVKIAYFDVREDRLMSMARKYASKERDAIEIDNIELAKEYLSSLAEKYLPHELGHSVYMHILSGDMRTKWDELIASNTVLSEKVVEIQTDKHPTKESIPIGNEAFADMFSEVVMKGKYSNRLGSHDTELDYLRSMLTSLGFVLES
jgi:hypothetical protein